MSRRRTLWQLLAPVALIRSAEALAAGECLHMAAPSVRVRTIIPLEEPLNLKILRAGAILGCADLAARGDGCTEEEVEWLVGQMQEYAASSDFAKERKTMLAEGKSGVVDAVREYQWSRSRAMPLTQGQKMRIAPNQDAEGASVVGCWLLSGGEEVDLLSDECLAITAKLTTAMTRLHWCAGSTSLLYPPWHANTTRSGRGRKDSSPVTSLPLTLALEKVLQVSDATWKLKPDKTPPSEDGKVYLHLSLKGGDGSRLSLKQLLHQGSGSEELASLVLAVKMGGCPWTILDTDELKGSTFVLPPVACEWRHFSSEGEDGARTVAVQVLDGRNGEPCSDVLRVKVTQPGSQVDDVAGQPSTYAFGTLSKAALATLGHLAGLAEERHKNAISRHRGEGKRKGKKGEAEAEGLTLALDQLLPFAVTKSRIGGDSQWAPVLAFGDEHPWIVALRHCNGLSQAYPSPSADAASTFLLKCMTGFAKKGYVADRLRDGPPKPDMRVELRDVDSNAARPPFRRSETFDMTHLDSAVLSVVMGECGHEQGGAECTRDYITKRFANLKAEVKAFTTPTWAALRKDPQIKSEKLQRQGYDRVYPLLFDRLRDTNLHMLHMGCQAEDLQLWSKVFPAATIVCVDPRLREDCRPCNVGAQTSAHYGDLSSDAFWESLSSARHRVGAPLFDVIVDGAPRDPMGQLAALTSAFTHLLKPGGTYLIEGTDTSYWSAHREASLYPTLAPLIDSLNAHLLPPQDESLSLGVVSHLVGQVSFGPQCVALVRREDERWAQVAQQPYTHADMVADASPFFAAEGEEEEEVGEIVGERREEGAKEKQAVEEDEDEDEKEDEGVKMLQHSLEKKRASGVVEATG